MRLNLNLSHKGFILVSVPLAFELVFVGVLVWLLKQAESEILHQVQSKTIIFQAATLSRLFHDEGVAIGGYNLTKNIIFKDLSDSLLQEIRQDFEKMQASQQGSSSRLKTVERIEELSEPALTAIAKA